MATNFGKKIDYNSDPVKKVIARCLLLPPFSGPGYSMVSFKFFPADPCCHGNEFWDKIDSISALVKNNCALFLHTPLFSGPDSPMGHLNFSHATSVAMATNFGTKLKIDYNSAPVKDNCALFASTHLIRSC